MRSVLHCVDSSTDWQSEVRRAVPLVLNYCTLLITHAWTAAMAMVPRDVHAPAAHNGPKADNAASQSTHLICGAHTVRMRLP